MFCRACGEIIKKEAELCPECGVRNSKSSSKFSVGRAYVSENWWYGVAIGTLAWVGIVLAVATVTLDSGGESVIGLVAIVAWALLPISAYYDMMYVRENGDWNPNTALWLIGLSIWFVNVVAGILYLIRRHEVIGVP